MATSVLKQTTAEEVEGPVEFKVGQIPCHPAAKWISDKAVPLTRESFLAMLDGTIPATRCPSFVSSETSQRLAAQLTPLLQPYLHATGPAVQKVGLAQFEFQAQSEADYQNRTGDEKERYFKESAKMRVFHDSIAEAIGENVWARAIATLAALVPEWDVSVASEGQGKEYFSGIFRCINNGTPIHCDWCPYDCNTEDWIVNRITKQAVFNIYITPVRGGKTTLYDVQWSPDALKYRDPNTYGYYPELVAGEDSCTFEPKVGDMFIFNSRNMHEVQAIDGSSEGLGRIAMASFMGLLPSSETGGKPRLMFWS